jgi:hypothetical protein
MKFITYITIIGFIISLSANGSTAPSSLLAYPSPQQRSMGKIETKNKSSSSYKQSQPKAIDTSNPVSKIDCHLTQQMLKATQEKKVSKLRQVFKTGEIRGLKPDIHARLAGISALGLALVNTGKHTETTLDIVNILLAHKANTCESITTRRNHDLQLPIHRAVMLGNSAVVSALLSQDSSVVNARSNFGTTPIMFAVGISNEVSAKNTQEAIRLINILIAHGADINITNNNAMNTLTIAQDAGNPHIMQHLTGYRTTRTAAIQSAIESPTFLFPYHIAICIQSFEAN